MYLVTNVAKELNIYFLNVQTDQFKTFENFYCVND